MMATCVPEKGHVVASPSPLKTSTLRPAAKAAP
jgi:hypothetical protein